MQYYPCQNQKKRYKIYYFKKQWRKILKKALITTFLLLTLFTFSFGKIKGFSDISLNLLIPADQNFKDAYSNSVFLPSLDVGIHIYRDFFIWAGYRLFTQKGETTTLKDELKYTEYDTGLGLGYSKELNESLSIALYSGFYFIAFKEELTSSEEVSRDSTLALTVGASVKYKIKNPFYILIGVNYTGGQNNSYDPPAKLGGIIAKAGFGINF